MQKFEEADEALSERRNIVVMADEAHRGQYGLAESVEAETGKLKYGTARIIRNNLPNATYIGFTGTPISSKDKSTREVFGDYIDTYYYDKSIADGYTLKLMREPVETIYKEKIENILDKLAGGIEVRRSDIDRNKIIEHESYLNALIDYIIADFRRFRIEQADDTVGAMIVCKTNPQAREMYRLWQERFNKALYIEGKHDESLMLAAEPMIAYGYHAKPLRASLILHDEGDKEERKAYIDEYKKKLSVDVLIVNQMLLTGFDAPRLKKLYLGRSLDGHDLLQALTRVNRPYHKFKYGYVVDFVNIKENFDATNDRYLRELNRTADIQETGEKETVGEALIVDKEQIVEQIKEIRSVLFNYTCDNPEEFRKEIDEIENKDNLYTLRSTLENAKAIINQVRAFGDEELKDKINSLPKGTIPTLITEVSHRIERMNFLESTEHKADVSGIINVALSELEFEFKKGLSEELRIIVNDIRERCEKVQAEFEANFDKAEDKYVILAEEFREYFRKKGFVPQNTQEAKESIDYMDSVMKKIREINRRNNILKKKYQGDERFVRIHKRIEEENEKREKPLISKTEYEIAESLSKMKREIDNRIYLDINIIANENSFKRDTLAMIGHQLVDLGIKASLPDRKFINNLIANEYINQYNQLYLR